MIGGKQILQFTQDQPALEPDQCIAKTVEIAPGNIRRGISVENHCRIVGLVAKELVSLFPDAIQKQLFPEGVELIAACHDIGKISPDFQEMLYEALPDYKKNSLKGLEKANPERAQRKNPSFHAAVSQVTLSDLDNYIPQILGVHHGFTPNHGHLQKGCSLHGGNQWQKERETVIERLHEFFGYPANYWPHLNEMQTGAIAGLVTVADWIGSGDHFSNLMLDFQFDEAETCQLIKRAVSDAGFRPLSVQENLAFTDIFPFSPNNIQSALIDSVSQPGIYILEAPMGAGKTEAALYAAYRILVTNQATGIYFALPTQLTSDKLYERMSDFISRIIDPTSGIEKTKLLHSSAWLNDIIMGEDADAGGSWFDGTKRGILAPFAVGTVDQALMAVMNVRHGFVRTFGLAGKVVILDEVHSYDTFTGTILNALIDCLRQLHCTVIVLSATLTQNQKKSLLKLDAEALLETSYPLISGFYRRPTVPNPYFEKTCARNTSMSIAVSIETDSNKAIHEAVERAASGQQVLWIENTVAEAQDVFRILSVAAHQVGAESGLLHSRFTRHDRANLEQYWVSLYGKEGHKKRKKCGRILVGTQVLEQSLDIDADFLVTRICPTDMLLQRIGRLWRHRENDSLRPLQAKCQVIVCVPYYEDVISKPNLFGKSSVIYSEYVLLRTLEIWKDKKTLVLPDDIRGLLEATYRERDEEGLAAKYKKELIDKKEKLQQMAAIGLSRGIQTLPESKASTRYSEIDSVDVLLLSDISTQNGKKKLRFLDNSELIVPSFCKSGNEKRKIAAELLKNCVRVSDYIAPDVKQDLSWLKPYIYVGSDNEQPLRVAVVQKDDELTDLNGTEASSTYNLRYNSLLGYQSLQKDKGRNI